MAHIRQYMLLWNPAHTGESQLDHTHNQLRHPSHPADGDSFFALFSHMGGTFV